MDFSLPPEIDRIRLEVRAFIEREVMPLEENPANYDAHENIRIDVLDEVRARAKALGLWAPVAEDQAPVRSPALQRTHRDAGHFAGRAQTRAASVGGLDVTDQLLAIFQADHASSSLSFGKIASSFFDSTSSAAASASAFSLRRKSRSSSLMRRRSAFFSRCFSRDASSGSASACVAAERHCSSSCGYTPCSRHQALLLASSIAAVASTASNRARAVQARSRAGLDSASARNRSNVATEMLSSCETVCTDALSGGNNLATALSLNACPYLATSSFRYRPRISDSIEATTSLTQGGCRRTPVGASTMV